MRDLREMRSAFEEALRAESILDEDPQQAAAGAVAAQDRATQPS